MTPRESTTQAATQPVLIHSGAPEYDAIVVGARVAGAATAMLLARRGRRVLLVDRRRPGSDTLSTHALMRAGVLQLKRWGLLDQVIAAGTPPVTKTVFRYGETVETIDIKPKAGVDALYAPRRTVLDTLLVDAAQASGVEVRFGVTVDGLCVDGAGRIAGIAAHDASGERFEAAARYTVGADGIRSVVALGTGAPMSHRGTAATAVVYGYFDDPSLAEGYDFSYQTGVSAGFIPTNDGQVNVWAGAPAARFHGELRSEPDHGFWRVLAEAAPYAVERVRAARLVGGLHGFAGEIAYMRQPWGPGWALVGDASHFKDPISAHGITDALRDAELLARAIDQAIAGGAADEAAALERYRETRDRVSLRMHEASDAIARYDWTTATVRDRLIEMSRSMNDEVELLTKLDAPEESPIAARVNEAAAPTVPSPASETAMPAAARPADEIAVAFLQALARRDWTAFERLLAPDVWMRALLPKRMHEETTAAGTIAIFRTWFDAPTAHMIEAEHHTLEGREHLCYRYLVRRDHAETPWYLVEQTGFCRVKDGKISRLDLVCTGYHPVSAANTYERAA